MSMNQSVRDAKRVGVIHCNLDCSLREAAGKMLAEDISALVVVDEAGAVAGIITRMDLLRAWMDTTTWGNERVSQYMSTQVVTVDEEVRLGQVAKILLEHHIHRVVVTRVAEGVERPIAVVAAADLIYYMTED